MIKWPTSNGGHMLAEQWLAVTSRRTDQLQRVPGGWKTNYGLCVYCRLQYTVIDEYWLQCGKDPTISCPQLGFGKCDEAGWTQDRKGYTLTGGTDRGIRINNTKAPATIYTPKLD